MKINRRIAIATLAFLLAVSCNAPATALTKADVDAIDPRWNYAQVEALLGPSHSFRSYTDADGTLTTAHRWEDGENGVSVYFDSTGRIFMISHSFD